MSKNHINIPVELRESAYTLALWLAVEHEDLETSTRLFSELASNIIEGKLTPENFVILHEAFSKRFGFVAGTSGGVFRGDIPANPSLESWLVSTDRAISNMEQGARNIEVDAVEITNTTNLSNSNLPIRSDDIKDFSKWVRLNGYNPYAPSETLERHLGYDFGAYIDNAGRLILGIPPNTPVRAISDGEVIEVVGFMYDFPGQENVTVKHLDGSKSIYAHLDDIQVKVGDRVRAGDVLADVLPSSVEIAHLHLELYDADGRIINPETVLRIGDIRLDEITSKAIAVNEAVLPSRLDNIQRSGYFSQLLRLRSAGILAQIPTKEERKVLDSHDPQLVGLDVLDRSKYRGKSGANLSQTVKESGGSIFDEKCDGDCLDWVTKTIGYNSSNLGDLHLQLINNGQSIPAEYAQSGDVVLYLRSMGSYEEFIASENFRMFESGKSEGIDYINIGGYVYALRHVGVVTRVDEEGPWIASKWGNANPVFETRPSNVPLQYGDYVLYFKTGTSQNVKHEEAFRKVSLPLIHLDSDYMLSWEQLPNTRSLERSIKSFGGKLVDKECLGDCLEYVVNTLGIDIDLSSFAPIMNLLLSKADPVAINEAGVGDIVVYFTDDTEMVDDFAYGSEEGNLRGIGPKGSYIDMNNRILGAKHIGIVSKIVNGRVFVTSKWMFGPVFEAPIDVNLDIWGESAVLFRFKTSDDGLTASADGKSHTILGVETHDDSSVKSQSGSRTRIKGKQTNPLNATTLSTTTTSELSGVTVANPVDLQALPTSATLIKK